MAANANPFIYPSAGGEGDPVNVNEILSFKKVNSDQARPDLPASQRNGSFRIQFIVSNASNNIRYLEFKYNDEGDRDDDYTSLLTKVGDRLQSV